MYYLIDLENRRSLVQLYWLMIALCVSQIYSNHLKLNLDGLVPLDISLSHLHKSLIHV